MQSFTPVMPVLGRQSQKEEDFYKFTQPGCAERKRWISKVLSKILFLLWGKRVEEQTMVNPCVSGCHMFSSSLCLCELEHFWEVSGSSGHCGGSVEEVRGEAVMSGH